MSDHEDCTDRKLDTGLDCTGTTVQLIYKLKFDNVARRKFVDTLWTDNKTLAVDRDIDKDTLQGNTQGDRHTKGKTRNELLS